MNDSHQTWLWWFTYNLNNLLINVENDRYDIEEDQSNSDQQTQNNKMFVFAHSRIVQPLLIGLLPTSVRKIVLLEVDNPLWVEQNCREGSECGSISWGKDSME